jgi:hypothetical protein
MIVFFEPIIPIGSVGVEPDWGNDLQPIQNLSVAGQTAVNFQLG